ncbi:MAG: ornithine cyclodeaminase family protein [Planctomycetota bacterium]|jgi:ornithine cyclodeaminase
MLVLSGADVKRALPMSVAVEGMKRAFAALSDGRAAVPLRTTLPIEAHAGVSLVMPALVEDGHGKSLAVKVVSLFEHNARRGLPRIQAAVLALEPETGRPVALLEGAALTAIRTGAASGAATELLARSESRTAAIFGAGVQARTQLEAVCTVRLIETVWVYDPAAAAVEALIAEMAGEGPIPPDVRPAADPRQAVSEADVICTATTSPTPVFSDADLKPGAHVNAVGSYQVDVQEIPAESVARALVVVDSRAAALAETGDLIQPIRQGLIGPEHVHAELGELVLGRKTGRASADQITLFKAVGVAVQDAVAARLALEQVEHADLGQRVDW